MVSLSNHVYNSTTYITLRQAQGDKKDFCKRLIGGKDIYRLRVGKYRILFTIIENIVLISGIGPRGDIYK